VYVSGAMTLSEPGQVDGLKVGRLYVSRGTVAVIGDGYFLMEGDAGTVRVNIGEETQIRNTWKRGRGKRVLQRRVDQVHPAPGVWDDRGTGYRRVTRAGRERERGKRRGGLFAKSPPRAPS
jgi:hypothetical protein